MADDEMKSARAGRQESLRDALAALAARTRGAAAAGTRPDHAPQAIRRRPRTARPGELPALPLSFAQRGLWFLHQLAPASPVYNVPSPLRLDGALDAAALERAWAELLRRNEVLRTTIAVRDGEPVQVVHSATAADHRMAAPIGGTAAPAAARRVLPRIDLRALPAAARTAETERWIGRQTALPFDLAAGPLCRASLIVAAADEHVLVLVLHHIVFDGWSEPILRRELAALYAARTAGPAPEMPEMPEPAEPAIQYGDFAAWQRALPPPAFAGPLAHWRARLEGAPRILELPADRPRPAALSHRGSDRRLPLPPVAAAALRRAAQREGVTPFMFVLAALQLLLGRYSRQDDLLIGSPLANRSRPEISGLIGFFVDTVVLRGRPGAHADFRHLLRAARTAVLDAFAHPGLPFELLVEELQPERDAARNPLVQVLLGYTGNEAGAVSGGGVAFSPLPLLRSRTAKIDLSLFVHERGPGLELRLEYSTDLYDAATAVRLLTHFATLAAAAAEAPELPLAHLPLATAGERHQMLCEWNDTAAARPPAGPWAHQRFAEQVRRRPEAPAVVPVADPAAPGSPGAGDVPEPAVVTYAGLDRRARQIGHALHRLTAAGGETRIGIALERSADLLAAVLAVWRSGAAYVALDPALPEERLCFQLEDARAGALLTRAGRLADLAAARGIPCLDPSQLNDDAPDPQPPLPERRVHADSLAYVIYTSGSTGRPKGVELSHGGLANLLAWHARTFEVTPADRATLLAGVGFDASVWEAWPYLTAGASLHILPDTLRTRAAELRAWLAERRITASWLPVPLAEALMDLDWRGDRGQQNGGAGLRLRYLLTGSDRLHRRPPPELPFPLLNTYGPTECTVICTSGTVPPAAPVAPMAPLAPLAPMAPTTLDSTAAQARPSIGRPLDNFRLHVVALGGGEPRAVPCGVPGELLIGGAGLARGYLRRPDLTAERFIPDPFAADPSAAGSTAGMPPKAPDAPGAPGAASAADAAAGDATAPGCQGAAPGGRLYRTGDLVRWLPNGELDFLGRIDQQVKIRGYRIELGEVEAVLGALPEVGEAAVLALDGALVAFASPVAGAPGPDAAALLAATRRQLPDYMVPLGVVPLATMPHNASGKIDRRALAALDWRAALGGGEAAGVAEAAPRGPVEELLAGLFGEVLGRREVRSGDNFFHLGGHSLSATRLVSRVREALGVELPVRALFEAPTMAALARLTEEALRGGAASALPPLRPVPRGERLPLSFAQQRLWFLDRLSPNRPAYSIPKAFALDALEGRRGRREQREQEKQEGLGNPGGLEGQQGLERLEEQGEPERPGDLAGSVAPAALAAAIGAVVRRHEVLRTRFVEVAGDPWQEILPAPAATLPVIDLSGLATAGRAAAAGGRTDSAGLVAGRRAAAAGMPDPADLAGAATPADHAATAARQRAECARLAAAEAGRPFDLAHGPLLRAALVRLGTAEQVLLLNVHHIASDGWSEGVLLRELSACYGLALAGTGAGAGGEESGRTAAPGGALPALPIQYGDYAAWQRAWPAEVLDRQLAYWKGQLAGAPTALALPTDRPRPAVQSFRGASRERLLSPEATATLRAAARAHGATLYMLLWSGFATLLARWTGQDDLLIGTPVANRGRAEIEGLIGFFVNTVALRARLDGDPGLERLLRAARATVLGAFAHQDLPFEAVVEELRPERGLGRNPLVQVMLTLEAGAPTDAPAGAGAGASTAPGAEAGEAPSSGTAAVPGPGAAAWPGHRGLRFVPLRLGLNTAAKFDLSLAAEEVEAGGGNGGRDRGGPGAGGTALRLDLQYATDLFTGATAERLLAHLATLLQGAAAAPEVPLSRLPLLSPAERHQLTAEWNDTAAPFPRRTIHRLFEEQAAAHPRAVAVAWEDGELTYGDLDRRAERIAAHLRRLGVLPGDRVGLGSERSGGMIAAVLGILKAGGAYLPLDASYPHERLELLLADAAPAALIGSRRELAALPAGLPRLALEDLDRGAADGRTAGDRGDRSERSERSQHGAGGTAAGGAEAASGSNGDGLSARRRGLGSAERPEAEEAHEAPAYVLYTSGSTGTPKGVEVGHQAVVRLVRETGYVRLGPGTVCLQHAPMSFDAATFEIWGALLNGGRLALLPPGRFSLPALLAAVERHGVNTLWMPTALLNLAVEEGIERLRGVRQIPFGGETASPAHLERALAALPGTELLHVYGPTENTTFSSWCRLRADWYAAPAAPGGPHADGSGSPASHGSGTTGRAAAPGRPHATGRGPAPIGLPIAGSTAHLLDRSLEPVPVGCTGEIHVGGAGVARGYLRRPELTAERFVPDPFGAAGSRLYRTGDLARRLPDGRIDFLGRRDHQVKVRGFRIEPGEVEAVLLRHPGVREAVVLPLADGGRGHRLVACYVALPATGVTAAGLRAYLRERLPEHIVPAAFVAMPSLPLNANGKVDRRALLHGSGAPGAPGSSLLEALAGADDATGGGPAATAGAARSPVEEVIAGIWEEVLDIGGAGGAGDAGDAGAIGAIGTAPWRGGTAATGATARRIGLDDNFFELGGHSLLVTRVLSRIREALSVELTVQALFEQPTVRALAAQVTEARRAARALVLPPLRPLERGSDGAGGVGDGAGQALPDPGSEGERGDRTARADRSEPTAPVQASGRLPLSFPQQRLWFLDRLAPDSPVYNVATACRLRGPLDAAALAGSLDAVWRRHQVLRTRFVEVDGEPWQEVQPASPCPLPLIDLGSLPAAAGEGELRRLARAEAARPFVLARGPLLRARLLRLAAGDHALLLNVHHVVADGWSIGILYAELSAFYGAATAGGDNAAGAPGSRAAGSQDGDRAAGGPRPRRAAAVVPPLPVQYTDYAAWQRAWPREVLARQLDYWRERLAGLATLEVPTDRPRPPVQTFRGGIAPLAVPAPLTAALRGLARAGRATLFMTVLAAWQALLHRITGQADVAVGTPVANRNRAELENLVGFFVNMLVLRADCGGDPSGAALVERVRGAALAAYDHADLPFERLVDELSPGRDLSRQPLVQVMYQLETQAPALTLAGLDLEPLRQAGSYAKFDLTLSLLDRGGHLDGWIEFSADLFDRTTVLRLAAHLGNLLAAVAAAPDEPLSAPALLSAAERHQMLAEWNDTRATLPAAELVHQLFAAAAERTPEAVAAVCAGREVTYAALAARVHRLARLLRGASGAPGALSGIGLPRGGAVGVWLDRSLDMLTAVLGILEAGGHYLPLDAAWPAERVEAILAATGARAVIAGPAMLPAVEEMRWRLPALGDTLCLAEAAPEPAAEPLDPESVRGLWDLVAERAVDRETAGGFVSAFTGLPFTTAEVDEYRDRVLSLAAPWLHRGARVLEIGCGAGLLLWDIAPRVARTVGIDPSPFTQERNRARLAATPTLAAGRAAEEPRVELLTGFAHDLDELLDAGTAAAPGPPEPFDLILLASTVQFFPGPRYFERVVARALRRLAPGGALLIADVPDARRRGELEQAIAAHRRQQEQDAFGAPAAAVAQVARGAARRELHLDEDCCRDLAALPGAGEVAILHRRAGFANELRFRFDVLLRRAAADAPARRRSRRTWTAWHLDRLSPAPLPPVASADDAAYVIHTSGSTGEPKGIVVQHRPVVNLIHWINRTFGVGAADRVLFVTSLSFDLSVYDIFGVLAAGGSVHVATAEELADPDRLVALLRHGGITLWDSAPAALVRLAPLFPEAAPAEPAALPAPATAPPRGHRDGGPEGAESALRLVLLSGDWIPVTLPGRVRRAFPAARVMALGGATEATVWSNWFPVEEVPPSWPSIPYGRPIANARYHALDAGFTPCPIGVPGDLYIGGDCLCSGYAGRPELTAPAFLPDPFAGLPGARLYRTGDRVRYLADGNLEFLGRLDHQVKVRGYRIELGEIELALARHPGVREAVVLARPAQPASAGAAATPARAAAGSDLQLVAYVVPAAAMAAETADATVARAAAMAAGAADATPARAEAEAVTADDLRQLLRRALPEYMMPAAFVFLPALPVTANGKLDRKALPDPRQADGPANGLADGAAEAEEAPRTPLEALLAGLWREVLGTARAGIRDNFFAAGGHSLLATQLVARVRQSLGVELPLRELFQHPTIAGLAEAVAASGQAVGTAGTAAAPAAGTAASSPATTAATGAATLAGGRPGAAPAPAEGGPAAAASPVLPFPPAPRDGELPLSFSQLRQWFLAQMDPGSAAYNVPLSLRLGGTLHVPALAAALGEIARRHETLRTTFPVAAGHPSVAVAAPAAAPPRLPLADLGALPPAVRGAEAHRLVQGHGKTPFDLTAGPLWRAALLRLDEEEHVLLFNVHHIVFDGWSLGVLLREIAALYPACRAGLPSPLPPLAVQYLDYAVWQRRWLAGEEGRRQLAYWRERLTGAARLLHLPTDRPRPAVQTFRGGHEPVELPARLAEDVRTLAAARGATLYMTLLAGLFAVLQRHTRQDDMSTGTFSANRRWQTVEPLLGFFINTLVLRADLGGDPSFRRLVERVREVTLGAFEHQDVPFERLLEELGTERDLSHTPLFQVLFSLQNFALPALTVPGLALSALNLYEAERANFDLALWLTEDGAGGLTGKLHYNRDLFDPATVRRLAGHLANLLRAATAAPEQPLAALPLLSAAERHQALHEWAGGGRTEAGPTATAAFRGVADMIRAHALQTPAAPALVHGGGSWSYAELDRRAGVLACRLRALGMGPERIVGVAVPRSPELIESLLATLRIGAAYLPLDPALPAERLDLLLADAGVGALVVPHDWPGSAANFDGPVVRVGGAEPSAGPDDERMALPAAAPQNLAYVLYTSGSTGRPKGVQVTHGALAGFTRAALAGYGLAPGDRVLQFAAPSFDTSVEEIFPCLAAGATLVLRDDEMIASPSRFLAACGDLGITVLDLPTAYWHQLAAAMAQAPLALPPALRLVILGGEAALPERVQGWLAAVGPHPRLVNSYGPTEATVIAAACVVEPAERAARMPAAAGPGATPPGDRIGTPPGEMSGAPLSHLIGAPLGQLTGAPVNGAAVPIGRPWGGARIWLLDPGGNPVPPGVAGELHIAGGGLARGYLRSPALTAAAFVPCPQGAGVIPGERCYRTGDLARHRPDGCLEFAGRIDDQVKVRGFRVEPGEIAAVLTAHPDVHEAAVVAAEAAPGDWRLGACVVPAAGSAPSPAALREFLKARLPAYMVPSSFAFLEALPLTATGKLDRAALPAAAGGTEGYAPPQTAIEELLVGIWQEVLRRAPVGVNDNLFDLGGHSLLLPQLAARIEQALQLELPLRTLFEAPTVAQLAVVLEAQVLAQIDGLSDDEAERLMADASLFDDPAAIVSTEEIA